MLRITLPPVSRTPRQPPPRTLAPRRLTAPRHVPLAKGGRAAWGSKPVRLEDDAVARADALPSPPPTPVGLLPPPLPPPPPRASVGAVLAFLARVALRDDPVLAWRLAFAALLTTASKMAGVAAPLALKDAFDAMAAPTGPNPSAALAAFARATLLKVAASLAREAKAPAFTPVAQAAARRVAHGTFAHVLSLDAAYHTRRRTGALARVLERGSRSVAMVFRAVVWTFVPTLIELAVVCALLASRFSAREAGAVAATFAAYTTFTVRLTTAAAAARQRVNALDAAARGRAVDALANVETIQSFAAETREAAAYDGLLVGYQAAQVDTDTLAAILNAGQSIILACGLGVVTAMIAATPGATPGDLVLANGLLLQIAAPLSFLGYFWRELRQSLVDINEMWAILRTHPFADGRTQLPAGAGGLAVAAQNVSFHYDDGRAILTDVSLTVPPGSSLAIVGPSGSGKSTLLRLLLRLHLPTAGVLSVGGVDVADVATASLRSAVAVVPQDTALFNATLEENIAFGAPDASSEAVRAAAAAAGLAPALDRMPAGLATRVGERGVRLSGGKRQRVAVARALLRRPRLLLCDEATSALDSATEADVLTSLRALASNGACTSIVVAHRLSTIVACDAIAVLKGGKVVEVGTHNELVARGGMYASMWARQAQHSHVRAVAGATTAPPT